MSMAAIRLVKVVFTLILLTYVGVQSQIMSTPSAGDCVCATTGVHGSQSGSLSSEVIVTLGIGTCGTILGGILTNDGYTWYEMKYGGQIVWVTGNYLKASPSSSCVSSVSSAVACPNIITRSEWSARPIQSVTYLTHQPVTYAFIHHSAGGECHNRTSCIRVVRYYQKFHMDDRGWDDIGYSFVVGGDGSVYEGRGWDRVGAHTKGYNDVGLGFCLPGNFMTKSPTQVQMDAVQQLIACGVAKGKIKTNYILRGHRDMVNYTSCPGDKLYSIIQDWPHYPANASVLATQ